MEIVLERQDEQVSVQCDGGYSHHFPVRTVLLTDDPECIPRPWVEPAAYGKILFQALFPRESKVYQVLIAPPAPQRIVLVTMDPLLQSVAWEYLYGPGGYLVCERHFVRGLPAERRQPPPSDLGALQVVVVPSNPALPNNPPLSVESEWENLIQAVADVDCAITFTRARPATLGQMRKLIAGKQHAVLHFIGHGNHDEQGNNYLCFENENASLSKVYSPELYQRIKGTTFLVTLNACVSAEPGPTEFSNIALSLVERDIPYVLGMQFVVLLGNAQTLSHTLFSELARGSNVEEAVFQARLELSHSQPEWALGVPVLYTSLSAPAGGFQQQPGRPQSGEVFQQPRLETIALPKPEKAFYGRAKELAQLGTWLTGPNRARLVTIHAGGGQGKTALAREAVERFAWTWPGGVWSSSLEVVPKYDDWLARLANFCSIKLEVFDRGPLETALRAHLKTRQTLLVLDNAETYVEDLLAEKEDALSISAFLNTLLSETNCSLLVTSRDYLGWSGEEQLELGGLSDAEGALLFLNLIPQRANLVKREEAALLSRATDGHPLSLRLLAGQFNLSTLSFPAFLADLDRQLGMATRRGGKGTDRHYSLANCLRTSWNALSPVLRGVWLNLSIFNGLFEPQIGAIFLAGTDANEVVMQAAYEQMASLQQHGLLEQVTTQPLREGRIHLYRMSVAARLFTQHADQTLLNLADGALSPAEQKSRFASAYTAQLRWLYNYINLDSRASILFRLFQEELERAQGWIGPDERGWCELQLGWLTFRCGLSPRYARELMENVLLSAQGIDPLLELHAYNQLGLLHQAIGSPAEALRYYNLALPILQKVSDRQTEASILNNIGEVYRATTNPEQALRHYKLALPIVREVSDRAGEAAILNNIGLVYQLTGNPAEALRQYILALSIAREVSNRLGEATTLGNIGMTYHSIGNLTEALSYYNLALPIRREVGDRAGEATTLINIGGVYQSTGNPTEALRHFYLALPIQREVSDRVGETATLNNIGRTYQSTGNPAEALRHYNLALPIAREVGYRLGEAATLNNIGEVYNDTGNPVEALRHYNLALPILREVGNRAGEAATLNNIGLVYYATGNAAEALLHYNLALPIRREVGDRVGEARTLNNIGMVFQYTGNPVEALLHYNMALPIMREVGDRSGEATTLYNLAFIHLDGDQPEQAIPLLQQVITIDRETSAVHAEAGDLYFLARVLAARFHRPNDAIPLLERSIRLFQQHHFERDDAGRTLAEHQQLLAQLQTNGSKKNIPLPPDFVERGVAGLSGSVEDKMALLDWLAELAKTAEPADRSLIDVLQRALFAHDLNVVAHELQEPQLSMWKQILSRL